MCYWWASCILFIFDSSSFTTLSWSGRITGSINTKQICSQNLISWRSYNYSYRQWRGTSVKETCVTFDLLPVLLFSTWLTVMCVIVMSECKLQWWCSYFSLEWLISFWTAIIHIYSMREGKSPVFQKISHRIKMDWLACVCAFVCLSCILDIWHWWILTCVLTRFFF